MTASLQSPAVDYAPKYAHMDSIQSDILPFDFREVEAKLATINNQIN